jgi:hypothetical protein
MFSRNDYDALNSSIKIVGNRDDGSRHGLILRYSADAQRKPTVRPQLRPCVTATSDVARPEQALRTSGAPPTPV